MQNNKFLLDLGMAKRAGRAVFGFDDMVKNIDLGHVKTVYLSSDISDNTAKRITRVCADQNVEVVKTPFSMGDIGIASGRKPTAIFAVTDSGFDKLLKKSLTNGGNA